MKRTIVVLFVLLLLPIAVIGQDDSSEADTTKKDESHLKWIRRVLFDREEGIDENYPKEVLAWVKEDIKKIGAWEYKIIKYSAKDLTSLEQELNALGTQKWECFWVKEQKRELIMFFKKPSASYLKSLPVKDMLKLISLTRDSDDSD